MKRLIMIIIASALFATSKSGFSAGDPSLGKEKSIVCSACHGADGNSPNSDYPSLAGQVPGYIAQQLARFKSGVRANAIMGGLAQTLTDKDMEDLDAWYSAQEPAVSMITEDQVEIAKLGEKLYRAGYKPMGIPACMPPNFPRIAGQHLEYTERQLMAFKSGQRRSDIMNPIAFGLSPEQMRALALYVSALH